MKRIGIAASRIAKDNLLLYNLCVVIISFLLSLLIFFISSFTLIVGIAIVSYIARGFMAVDPGTSVYSVLLTSMSVLGAVVGIINLVAILVNIKIRK